MDSAIVRWFVLACAAHAVGCSTPLPQVRDVTWGRGGAFLPRAMRSTPPRRDGAGLVAPDETASDGEGHFDILSFTVDDPADDDGTPFTMAIFVERGVQDVRVEPGPTSWDVRWRAQERQHELQLPRERTHHHVHPEVANDPEIIDLQVVVRADGSSSFEH